MFKLYYNSLSFRNYNHAIFFPDTSQRYLKYRKVFSATSISNFFYRFYRQYVLSNYYLIFKRDVLTCLLLLKSFDLFLAIQLLIIKHGVRK